MGWVERPDICAFSLNWLQDLWDVFGQFPKKFEVLQLDVATPLQQTSLWFFLRCWGEQPCNRYFSIIVISNHIPAVPPRSQPSSLPTGSVCTPMPTKIMDKGSSKQFLQKAKNRLLRSDADLLPKPTWWHRMQSIRREWLTSLVLFACINWMGKSVTNVYRVVSKCWQTSTNTIPWHGLTFFACQWSFRTLYLGTRAWLVGQLPLGPGDKSEKCIEMTNACSRCS